jgi:threonine dehydratase
VLFAWSHHFSSRTLPAAVSAAMPNLTLDDLHRAAARIGPFAVRTLVLRADTLDTAVGAHVWFKCENLQRTGSFKFRGATNAVRSLDDSQAARGVVAHSSGNHGAALAEAARMRGIPAHIVVPEGAIFTKVEAIRRAGAHLIRCAPTLRAREETAAQVRHETGAELVHPYDDVRVAAGQGTACLELLEEQPDLDVVLVPVGGGGLASGTCIAATDTRPGIRVIGVEPHGADDARRCLAARGIVPAPPPDTICDGLRATLAPFTFGILSARLHEILTAPDSATREAVRLIHAALGIVVEPSSAVVLAALLGPDRPRFAGLRVGVILTGGNVDSA